MPEHLRALVVILVVASTVFAFAKQPMSAVLESEEQFRRDRNAWFTITAVAFIAHNFWLYAIITAVLVARYSKTHATPLALYLLLLVAVPPVTVDIPGIGPIDYLISINHYRLLNCFLLLPVALKLHRERHTRPPGPRATDFFVVCLLLWMFYSQAATDPIVHALRAGLYLAMDAWLPYYVASRSLQQLRDFRHVATAVVASCAIVALLAVLESIRHWLLYDGLRGALGVASISPVYLMRGEGGPLRAMVSLDHAIVLGFVLAFSVAMLFFIFPSLSPKWKRNAAAGCLIAGLIASVSRGPWVGCAAMLLVAYGLGPNLGKRIARGIFIGSLLIGLILVLPIGKTIVAYLPFVGTAETGTVEYRARLFDVSMEVFRQHPLAGDFRYLKNPLMEQMRQGEGIIDMVNSYLQIALPFGMIGLTLFASVFLSALLGVNRVRRASLQQPEVERLGRTLLGALLGMLVTIGTVSMIGAIPTMLYVGTGICAAYARAFDPARERERKRSVARKVGRVASNPAAARSGK